MAGIKIVDLPALGRDLISTDLLEVSLNGSGSRKITGQEIMNASKLAVGSTSIVSGTVGRLLFQGTGNVLQQSSSLFWDNTNTGLSILSETATSAERGILLKQFNNGVQGALSTFQKSRGSIASPANVAANDLVGLFQFSARVGGTYTADRAIFGANMATSTGLGLFFSAGSSDGSYIPSLYIHPTGNAVFGSSQSILTGITDAGFKLDVNGTARVSGLTTLSDGLRINGGWTTFNASTIFGSSAQSGNTFNFATQYIGGATGTTNYFNFSGTLASGTGGSFNVFNVQQTFSNTNSAQTFRGFYYNPNITGLQAGTTHRAIETTSGDVIFGTTSGTLSVGTTTIVNMNYGEVPKTYLTGGTFINGTLQLPTTLRVIATGGGIQFQQQSAPSTNSLLSFGNDTNGVYFGNFLSLGVRFLVGSTPVMTLASTTANVLINTTTDAGFKLDVNGTARVSGALTVAGIGTVFNSTTNTFFHTATGGVQTLDYYNGFIIQNAGQVVFKTAYNGNSRFLRDSIFGSDAANNASAQVEIVSTTKGFLPPRMTNAQRAAIASPAVGLIVYCTDSTEGLYVYKSTGWTFMV